MKQRFLLLFILFTGLLSGCGKPVGEVTGIVRYRGVALTSGTITFRGADGEDVATAIGQDGRYQVSNVAVGEAKIAVESHPRVPPGMLGGAKPAEKTVTIPPHYNKPDTSRLTYLVSRGRQTKDFDLEP